jgi:hypothetical protein
MQPIPIDISAQFEAVLKKRAVPVARHGDYRKWLRYYLDFRSKYPLPNSRSEQVRLFIEKLRQKGQTPDQQKQAAHALSLFFESQSQKKVDSAGMGQMPVSLKDQSALSSARQAAHMPSAPAVSFQSDFSTKASFSNLLCLSNACLGFFESFIRAIS